MAGELTWIVAGDPPLTRCRRSGGKMLSRIRFSCSRVALVGPWLLTTLEAEIWKKVNIENDCCWKISLYKEIRLNCVSTSVLRMRLLHVVAFSKKLRWLAQIKGFTLKTQLDAVKARWKRLSQCSCMNQLLWSMVKYINNMAVNVICFLIKLPNLTFHD